MWGIILRDLHTTARVLPVLILTRFDVEEREKEHRAKKEEVPVQEVCLKALEVCPREAIPMMDYLEMETEALLAEQKVVVSKT